MSEFPAVATKYSSVEVVTAHHAVQDWRARGAGAGDLDAGGAVMVYDNALYRHLLERESPERVLFRGPGRHHRLARGGGRVILVGDFGFGAPVAAAVLEVLIAAGVERVVSIGTAGGLQDDLRPGDIIGVTGAIRDEGTSWHYLPGDRPVRPDASLSGALFERLGEHLVTTGTVWTNDAVYRETVAEVIHHRAHGVQAVEMEASALMAVAEVRGAALASAVCISDLLTEDGWQAMFSAPAVRRALVTLFDAAVDALASEEG